MLFGRCFWNALNCLILLDSYIFAEFQTYRKVEGVQRIMYLSDSTHTVFAVLSPSLYLFPLLPFLCVCLCINIFDKDIILE